MAVAVTELLWLHFLCAKMVKRRNQATRIGLVGCRTEKTFVFTLIITCWTYCWADSYGIGYDAEHEYLVDITLVTIWVSRQTTTAKLCSKRGRRPTHTLRRGVLHIIELLTQEQSFANNLIGTLRNRKLVSGDASFLNLLNFSPHNRRRRRRTAEAVIYLYLQSWWCPSKVTLVSRFGANGLAERYM